MRGRRAQRRGRQGTEEEGGHIGGGKEFHTVDSIRGFFPK